MKIPQLKTQLVSRSNPKGPSRYTPSTTQEQNIFFPKNTQKLNYGENLTIKKLVKQFSHIPFYRADPQQTQANICH